MKKSLLMHILGLFLMVIISKTVQSQSTTLVGEWNLQLKIVPNPNNSYNNQTIQSIIKNFTINKKAGVNNFYTIVPKNINPNITISDAEFINNVLSFNYCKNNQTDTIFVVLQHSNSDNSLNGTVQSIYGKLELSGNKK